MKTIIHRANERGYADHGWLKTHHSFSFANWFDEKRIHFGMLRVVNDDLIAPGMGFGMHPHDNMEIVTIPLRGTLEHKDSMGNTGQIKFGEIQAMSAGTGVFHSEYNPSATEETELFQIWVFPKVRDINPRYEQQAFPPEGLEGKFRVIVSPVRSDKNLWINQDAYFSLGSFSGPGPANYSLNIKGNGVYLMVIEGKIEVGGVVLDRRDAMEISASEGFEIKILKTAKLLVIEVPLLNQLVNNKPKST